MTIMDMKIGNLEEEALKRKERLNSLKRKRDPENEDNSNKEKVLLPQPKFRSYQPEDETLQATILPIAKPGNVENEVKDVLSVGTSRIIIDELDLQNLAPRKPDWDLKRDVAKKLDILEKRTQRAIAELIRERLKERQSDDLAAIVSAVGNPKLKESDEDRET